MALSPVRPLSALRALLTSEAGGGVILALATALALGVANSGLAPAYFGYLHRYVAGLSVLHWINDGLMAVFFLFWLALSSSASCSMGSCAPGVVEFCPPPRPPEAWSCPPSSISR